MHFCHEELYTILAAIPGLTYLSMKARIWWHKRYECQHDEKLAAPQAAEAQPVPVRHD